MTHQERTSPTTGGSQRNAIRIACDPQHTIAICLSKILDAVQEKGLRDVLVHLVDALFRVCRRRIKSKCNHSRDEPKGFGDLKFGRVTYYVALTPTTFQLRNCKKDLEAQWFPVLLVPESAHLTADRLARRRGIKQRLTIFSLEGFFVRALLFQAVEQGRPMFDVWKKVVSEYNRKINAASLPPISLE